MWEIIIFAICLALPFAYYRTLFYVAAHVFDRPPLRTKTGLQIHHLHYGVAYIFVASLLILFAGTTLYAIAFLGLGLGCMLDEFIASLMMPGDRPVELKVYKNALPATAALLSFIVLFLIFMAILFNRI
jgi:hypothetical protein